MGDEALTAGAVARRLGVAVTTLRTWHQRYGLGPSQHVPGRHRRYTAEDMDRLQVMRRLTAQGVAPAEAAAWARRVPVPLDIGTGPDDVTADTPEREPAAGGPTADAAPGATDDMPAPGIGTPRAAPGISGPRRPARDGGGLAIPVGRAGPTARGLARAAMRLDAPAARDILQSSIAGHGVVRAWDEIILPVLIGIGARYQATQRFIEVEHLASRCISEVLGAVPRPSATYLPRVLLTAADEEQHTLPLEALAAALAEAGTPTRMLGARVPSRALSDAVARTGPAVVVMWSQLPETAHPSDLERLLTGPRRPMLVAAAGPGWSPEALPGEVPMLCSLADAVRVIRAAAA
ncbi:MerR family transcriptional regulator [Mangrovihabitans endophyticus]|uniref:Transcriptional regulator n=1 Tax=Mangrovihabitans endophyticus TaxID=1751298 RepID=A0A8J3FPI0_9ACTN|nr:MerR family transcriptional regulator [Mangrovihabitans endophyticus]GGK95495.1 transcriptional regulator [Mangrovihabitans endophyticus]